MGGAQLVSRYQGLSADHIEYLDEAGVAAMRDGGTVGVLLPGAFYFLRETQRPPVELLRRYQVPVAVASDFNPGTSPFCSLHLAMNMACVQFGLTPEEAWAGVTRHAARALGRQATHGQIRAGYRANFVVWDAEQPVEIVYEPGVTLYISGYTEEKSHDANGIPASPALWQGRDDSIEAPDARRLFQTVTRSETFSPENWQQKIALMGFACDEGVKRNAGRPGAAGGPDALRKALANMASHQGHERLVDLGNWVAPTPDLEGAQQALRDAVSRCLRAGMRTLVLGGGHETAFGHGAGVLDAFAQESVGIINLDAHLDLRQTDRATSGTPFRQLAQLCDVQSRAFHYACFGVSRAANTQALWREAQWRNVTVVEDLDCHDALAQMTQFIDKVDKIYLTIDLDVLPVWEMPAVSAPAALGVPLIQVLRLIEPVCRSGKLQAADLVEFNPRFDEDGAAARVAARLGWQIAHWWR
ncbi:formimidoylglutamase [Salmonella enterica subsp. enterica serovar Daytona]|nr:formimidoylglutamase [Salmonella enterica subsp. enterica serovar Daytona]